MGINARKMTQDEWNTSKKIYEMSDRIEVRKEKSGVTFSWKSGDERYTTFVTNSEISQMLATNCGATIDQREQSEE